MKELALLYEWPTVGRSGDWGKRVRDMLEDDEIRRRMERPMLRKSVQTTIWEHLYSEIYLGNDIPVESNVTWDNLRQRVMAAIAKKMSDAMRLDGEIARVGGRCHPSRRSLMTFRSCRKRSTKYLWIFALRARRPTKSLTRLTSF